MKNRITSWPLARINVSAERRRAVNEAVVLMLMSSIRRRGLLSPIRIRTDGSLVCGLHRLVAHERLGLETIEVIIDDSDAVDAELDEIEENLARRELTVLERALAERRQKQLYLHKYPESRHGVAGALARHLQAKSISFASAHADDAQGGRRMVEQRIQIAEALRPETVAVLAEAAVAKNHTQLLTLGRAPEELRHPAAVYLAEHGTTNVRAAIAVVSGSAPADTPARRAPNYHLATSILTVSRGRLSGIAVLGGRKLRLLIDGDHESFTLRDVGPALAEPLAPIPVDYRPLTLGMTAEIAAQIINELPPDLAVAVTLGRIRAVYDPAGRRAPRLVQTIAVMGTGTSSGFEIRWLDASERFPNACVGAVLVEVDRRPFLLHPREPAIRAESLRQAVRDALIRALRGARRVCPDLGRLYRADGGEWSFNRVSPALTAHGSGGGRLPLLCPPST